ncbi:OsmC family protein [Pseudactinotalea sp.]|uniref:OsmC family protein n=1 Tax=Pseudactinotalea sp. TaxID=1926260 RepID=UPI003B3B6E70
MAELQVERTGTRQGVATNGRGAELRFGPVEADGAFTPGELLALALAACNLMSADPPLTRRLGDDARVTGSVTTVKDVPGNAYVDSTVELAIEGAEGLDGEAWAELVDVASRSIERACTVGRTLESGLPHTLTIRRA